MFGELPVAFSNVWEESLADIVIPDGEQAIYFVFRGEGKGQMLSFTLA